MWLLTSQCDGIFCGLHMYSLHSGHQLLGLCHLSRLHNSFLDLLCAYLLMDARYLSHSIMAHSVGLLLDNILLQHYWHFDIDGACLYMLFCHCFLDILDMHFTHLTC